MNVLILAILTSTPIAGSSSDALPPIDLVRRLRAARIAHLEGDHGGEFETLRQAHEAFPDDMSLVHALLVHHRSHTESAAEIERLRSSMIALLEAPTSQPPASVLTLILGDTEVDRDFLRTIAAHLERRTRGADRDAELLELLTYVYSRLEDVDGGLAALERLVEVEPTDLRRWLLVHGYRTTERWQDAVRFVRDWLEDADSPELLRATYIDLLSRAGELGEVSVQLDRMLAEHQATRAEAGSQWISQPNQTTSITTAIGALSVVKKAAWNLRDAGEDAAAEKFFRQVVELDPEDEEAANALLYLYAGEGELRQLEQEAAARWQQEEDPNSLFEEGTQRLTAGDAESAFELLKRAAPGLPELEAAWYNLGMAAYRVEEWATVAEAFGKAAELNPERSQSFFFRGLALEKLGQCQESVAALEAALALDAGRHLAHYYLAACYRRLGDSARANEHRALYDASR